MLKTTTEQRHQIYQLDRDMGLRTIGELRALEELPPLPGESINDDPIPLQVLVAMSRGTAAVPKSLLPLLSFQKAVPGALGGETPTDPGMSDEASSLASRAQWPGEYAVTAEEWINLARRAAKAGSNGRH
jgi:hypothetical protein